MTTELDLAQRLFEAQQDGRHDVDAALFAGLDRDAAYRVQTRVMDMLGEAPALLKTGIAPDGVGTVAPIFRSRVGDTGKLRLNAANLIGVEVEIGFTLAADVDSDVANSDEAAVVEAIGDYFVGIEICGTRFADRKLASPNAGIADNASALGYAINHTVREAGADFHNYDVIVEFNGQQVYNAPARHSFGTVLASFLAYAKAQHPAYPLKAGTIITTGSLCGLVPLSGPGVVVGRLGSHSVEAQLV